MKIINYEFIEPKLLEDVICNILIMYNINYCSITENDYIEIHFENHILRVDKNSNKTVFDTTKILFLIIGLKGNTKEKSVDTSCRTIMGEHELGITSLLANTIQDMTRFEVKNKTNKYKDINYISKKKMIKNNNKNNKTNTYRK